MTMRPSIVQMFAMYCQVFARELRQPIEPKRLRVAVTRAVVHRIFRSDNPASRTVRTKFPLTGTKPEEVVNPSDPEDRVTVSVETDLSGEVVPWDVDLRQSRR